MLLAHGQEANIPAKCIVRFHCFHKTCMDDQLTGLSLRFTWLKYAFNICFWLATGKNIINKERLQQSSAQSNMGNANKGVRMIYPSQNTYMMEATQGIILSTPCLARVSAILAVISWWKTTWRWKDSCLILLKWNWNFHSHASLQGTHATALDKSLSKTKPSILFKGHA